MTKQLLRLNIKPPYSTRPIASSGHRHINIPPRKYKSYTVVFYTTKYKGKTFKELKHALCYKFILILKNKANIKPNIIHRLHRKNDLKVQD